MLHRPSEEFAAQFVLPNIDGRACRSVLFLASPDRRLGHWRPLAARAMYVSRPSDVWVMRP